MRPVRGVLASALVACSLLAWPAPALARASAADVAGSVTSAVERHDWRRAREVLTEAALELLDGAPTHHRTVMADVGAGALAWILKDKDVTREAMEDLRSLQRHLEPHATRWHDQDPTNRAIYVAYDGLLSSIGMAQRRAHEPFAETAIRLARVRHARHLAAEGDERLSTSAITSILWAVDCPTADAAGLLAEATTWIEEAEALKPGHPPLVSALGQVRRAQADVAWNANRRSEAARHAKEALRLLLEAADADPKTASHFATYHDAVRWASRRKLVKNPEVRLLPTPVDSKWVPVQIPAGREWSWEYGKSGEQHRWTITRKEDSDIDTSISLYVYSWAVSYTSPDGDFKGDNLQGLLKQDEAVDSAAYDRGARTRRNLRTGLNRNLPKADGYEIVGTIKKALTARTRRWYIRDTDRQRTYSISLEIIGPLFLLDKDIVAVDAEVEAVLDSIRVIPKDK